MGLIRFSALFLLFSVTDLLWWLVVYLNPFHDVIFQDTPVTAQEGDSKYLAPEVLNSPPGKPADIFSLGISILELATDLDLPSRGDGWRMLREGNIPEVFTNSKVYRKCCL